MWGAKPIKPVNKFYSILLLNHLHHLCICDGDFDLYARLNADGGDLLDNLRWTVQINQTLVDPHLEAIPGLGSLTTGGFPGGDTQSLEGRKQNSLALQRNHMNKIWLSLCEKLKYLGWHADWSLHLQVLFLSAADQVGTDWGIKWKKMIRHVGKQTFWLSYIWGAMAQNSVYKSSGCISSNFYPHCSGLCFILVLTVLNFYSPFSRDLTLRLVRVMRMRWMATSVSTGALPVSLKAYMSANRLLTHLICHQHSED